MTIITDIKTLNDDIWMIIRGACNAAEYVISMALIIDNDAMDIIKNLKVAPLFPYSEGQIPFRMTGCPIKFNKEEA